MYHRCGEYTTGISRGYSHEKSTKEEHEDKVSGASSERALLQHPTVSVPLVQQLRKNSHLGKENVHRAVPLTV